MKSAHIIGTEEYFRRLDADYEKESRRLEETLRPLLTDEWLATLIQAARTYGWNGDYIEVQDFVNWLHEIAGHLDFKTLGRPFQVPEYEA